MLRSLNADPLDPPNATPTERLLSVVYPGPAVAGALVFWRAGLRSISVNNSASLRVWVKVPRVTTAKPNVLHAVPSPVAATVAELSGAMMVDLVPGDQIELGISTGTVGVWQVNPYGFSVDVR